MEIWDVWYPEAGAQGLSFGRGRIDPTDQLVIHSPPPVLKVEVRDDAGALIALGENLARTEWSPMALLERRGDRVVRQDLWPDETLNGTPVMLPGGDVGILLSWWNSDAKDEWRWRVEFYNHR